MKKRWKKTIFSRWFRSTGASFRFARAFGRAGTIEYQDSSGVYELPYQMGAGVVAFELGRDSIVKRGTEDAISKEKADEIISEIDNAIWEYRKKHVAAI